MESLGDSSVDNSRDEVCTVLVVEDDPATRTRIANIIEASTSFKLQGPAKDFSEAAGHIKNSPPDLLLTDLQLPDGSGIGLIASVAGSNTKALVLTVMGDETSVIEAIKAGASGYLLKDDDGDDIINSLSLLLEGQAPLSPSIARYLLKQFATDKQAASTSSQTSNDILTRRETDVLHLVAKGYSYAEIADVLALSVHTVASHVKNIYKKLDVNSRGEAVFEASQMGLLSNLS